VKRLQDLARQLWSAVGCSFEPLRKKGRAVLRTHDVDGIDRVRLQEVQLYWGGPDELVQTISATDVFSDLERTGEELPSGALIISATFEADFERLARRGHFGIDIAGRISDASDADEDAAKEWLLRRGFIPPAPHGCPEASAALGGY